MSAIRRAFLAVAAIAVTSCTDSPGPTGPSSGPLLSRATNDEIGAAIAAQERHTAALLRIPGVLGTAVGYLPNGRIGVRILLQHGEVRGIPSELDGVPAAGHVTGLLMAYSNPTTRSRPAPLGFSVGHPSITAGSIGVRVRRPTGEVFLLSNNHVLANSNDAGIGDPILQPGPYDGGTAADQVATLADFQPIDFAGGSNTMDAAIAATTTDNIWNSTPTDDGYGLPAGVIWGDADQNGQFDNRNAALGVLVQKYGRTTSRTTGQITGINATVDICYEVLIIFCVKSARFTDQFLVEPGGFSGGGDSGSLIVTNDGSKNPIALLFAGSSTQTIANRIDLVLARFGVVVDVEAPPPPTPLTDVAVSSVTAPATVMQGSTASVAVTVRNAGNQPVGTPFDITLQDATDGVVIGTQSVASLAVGATATRTFSWNTAGSSAGPHTLSASHSFPDDNAANNQQSTASSVLTVSSVIHVGDLDGMASADGTTWSATVEITVHDGNEQPVNGATIVGAWSRSGLNANECTTGELGGNGTCIVLFPSLRKSVKSVSFTVQSVTMPDRSYAATSNHDVDGGSNGTTVTVNRP